MKTYNIHIKISGNDRKQIHETMKKRLLEMIKEIDEHGKPLQGESMQYGCTFAVTTPGWQFEQKEF